MLSTYTHKNEMKVLLLPINVYTELTLMKASFDLKNK